MTTISDAVPLMELQATLPGVGVNEMDALAWVPRDARSLLDVGCNAGELLELFRPAFPEMRLVGVDVNAAQMADAAARLPGIEFRHASGDALPFADGEFDCATCIEVLEHIPERRRPAALREIHRVVRPGGRFILRVPHAGAFEWLDSNNLRFRFPRLYGAAVGRGRRDEGYAEGTADVVWHHHFSKAELLELLGPGWVLEAQRMGALFLLPLMDLLCWPFYRLRRIDNPLFRALQRIARWDIAHDYGQRSFNILLVFRRI